MRKPLFLLLTAVLLLHCGERKVEPTLFISEEHTGIDFVNSVNNTRDFNIFSYRNFYNGGGAAIGDINNDGLADVFLTSNMGENKLYLNKGNWKFEDISKKAGLKQEGKWSTGVVLVDINHDGWLDIYVCNAGYQKGVGSENQLYINNHDLTFTESAHEYGLDDSGYTTHAAFFDYDLDGDLDCYILNNSFIPVNTLNYSNKRDLQAKDWPVENFLKGGGDKLLRNDNGHFTDVSEQAGIYGSLIGFGLGVTVGDVNGDGYPDIYVSNDFFERDYLYINQRNGTFKESLEQSIQHISMSSMGADMADINNDGYPDIFTTDMLPADDYRLKTTSSHESIDVLRLKEKSGFYHQFMQNTLQVNNRNGMFSETGYYSGVAASDWSWGALVFDADNDGLSDLYVCNGIYHDVTDQDFIDFFANDVIQKMVLTGEKEQVNEIINKMPSHPIPNKAFHNLGNLHFKDAAADWGLATPSFSNGAAYGDLDNDGDLDLVVNNVNEKAFVYRNNTREWKKNHYLGFRLKGIGQNTFAVGSKIKLYQGTQLQSRELIPSRGFQSSVDYKIIFGLSKPNVDSIEIDWPNRGVTKILRPAVDTVLDLQETGKEPVPPIPALSSAQALTSPVAAAFEKHQEDDFIDFNGDRNLIRMLSREGPKAAVGDVNGDGLEDIYIGGANGQAGQLYMQTANGFMRKNEKVFDDHKAAEDVAVLLFDCDGDGDLDLFIGSGGNNHPPRSPELQHRLYLNDGNGNFTESPNAFPNNNMNISVAVAADFDGDGDMDLFVGGRSIPYNYGMDANSYVFMNDGKGKFTDIAPSKNKDISQIGLVTGAAWADLDGDSRGELVVVGEWMAPRIFSFQGGHFVEKKSNLDGLNGWWQTVGVQDLNGDGLPDLVLGNFGENCYIHPDSTHPVKLWINDFDLNGSVEKIMTRTIDGRDMPVLLKRDLTDQVVSLKKQNLKYTDFARKSIQELFAPDIIKGCQVKTFNYCSTVIAINQGGFKFKIEPLPPEVQFSSVNAVCFSDVDGDGRKDLVLGGNIFDFLPQFSRLDASFGHVLLNRGEGKFEEQPVNSSGIAIRGQIRDICEIGNKKNRYLLFLQNDDYPLMYKLNKTGK